MKAKPDQATPTSQTKNGDAPGSTKRSRLWLLLPVLLAGCVAIWFQYLSGSKQRVLDKAIDFIVADQPAKAREQLAELRKVPEYESRCRVLDGVLLVKEEHYDWAIEFFDPLPDDERVRALGLTHRGIANYHLGNLEESIDDLETSQAIDRENRLTVEWLQRVRADLHPDQQLKEGLAFVESADLKSASLVLKRLEQNPNAPQHAELLKGMIELSNNRIETAMESFSISIKAPALREMSLLGSARALVRRGDSKSAVNVYSAVARENDQSVEAHRWLANWYYNLRPKDVNSIVLAERHLQRLIALTPQDPQPIHTLAKLYVENKRLELAGQQYEKVWNMNLTPELRNEVALEASVVLLGQDRNDLAWDLLQTDTLTQIRDKEKLVMRDTLRAVCLINQGELEKALELLDAILVLDPDNLDALVRKGEVMSSLGMLEEAVGMYEKAIELAPAQTVVLEQLALLYRRIDGMEDKAVAVEKRIEQVKELQARMKELKQIASGDPNDTQTRIELGRISYQLGDPNTAKSWFEAVLKVAPGHGEAKKNLTLLEKGQPIESESLEKTGSEK